MHSPQWGVVLILRDGKEKEGFNVQVIINMAV